MAGLAGRVLRARGGSSGAGIDTEARAQIAALEVDQTAQDALIAAMPTQAQVAAIQVQIAANVDNPLVDAARQPDGSLLLTWEDGSTSTVPPPPSIELATPAEFFAQSGTTAASPAHVWAWARVQPIGNGLSMQEGRTVYLSGSAPSVGTGNVPADATRLYGVMVDAGATLTVPGIGDISNPGTSKAQFLFRSTGVVGQVEQIGSDTAVGNFVPLAAEDIGASLTAGDYDDIASVTNGAHDDYVIPLLGDGTLADTTSVHLGALLNTARDIVPVANEVAQVDLANRWTTAHAGRVAYRTDTNEAHRWDGAQFILDNRARVEVFESFEGVGGANTKTIPPNTFVIVGTGTNFAGLWYNHSGASAAFSTTSADFTELRGSATQPAQTPFFHTSSAAAVSIAANANAFFDWTPSETDNVGITKSGGFFVADTAGLYFVSAHTGQWNTSAYEAWAYLFVDLFESDRATLVREVTRARSRTLEVDGTGNKSGVSLTATGLVRMSAGQAIRPRYVHSQSSQIVSRSFSMYRIGA